jgi:hypothetical protein
MPSDGVGRSERSPFQNMLTIAAIDPVLRIRILALIIYPLSTFFGVCVCKSYKYFRNPCWFNFLDHENILFRAYFYQINSRKKLAEIYLGQDPYMDSDPDPEIFKSRIRIRSKIVRIRNTGYTYFCLYSTLWHILF